MKKLLTILLAVVFVTVALNAECTKEQKIKLILNGVDQSTIDDLCTKKDNKALENSISKDNKTIKKRVKRVKRVVKKRPAGDAISRERFYIGLAMFSGSGTISLNSYMYSWYSGDYDVDVWGSGFAFGYIFDNNDRVEFAFGNQTIGSGYMEDSDFEYTKISYIHTFGDKYVPIKSFTPFISLGFQNFVGENYQIATYDTIEGGGYSVGAGAIYSLNKDVELDISFAYTFIDIGEYWSYDPYSMMYYDAYYDLGYSSINFAAKYKF